MQVRPSAGERAKRSVRPCKAALLDIIGWLHGRSRGFTAQCAAPAVRALGRVVRSAPTQYARTANHRLSITAGEALVNERCHTQH